MHEIGKNSVLIVDDENLNITALTHILSPEYTVYAAKNGRSAIKAAGMYLPDVILLDIIMTDMDGYAVITELRKSERTQNIPVIFISSLDSAEEEEKGLAFGAADYIIKPFSPAIVKLRVQNQIKIQQQLRALNTFESDLMKYMLASDALEMGLWDMDVMLEDPLNPDNYFTFSPEYRRMVGYSDERDFPNLFSSFVNALHPEDRERALNDAAAHLNDYSGRTPYDSEYRLRQKNGEYRHYRAFGNTQRDNKGVPLRAAGAIIDITERKQALESDLMKYVLTSDALQMGLWDMDVVLEDPLNPDITMIFSPEYRHLIGYSDESDFPNLVGSWLNGLHPEDIERTCNAGGAHLFDFTGKTPYDVEYRFKTKTGEYRHYRAFGRSQRNSEGVPLRVAGAIMDITEKKQMEHEIAKANKRTEILLDKTPLCCELWDKNLSKIDCNEAAIRLFGFKDKQEYLQRSSELYPEFQPDGECSDEKVAKFIRKAFAEGNCSFDFTYKMLDGTLMPAEVILIRVDYEDGHAVAAYTRDLREYHAVLAEMRRAEIAEESNKAKSKFLAMMSHEIRTPMNAVLGITEIHLQDEALDPKYEEAFGKIHLSSNLLLGIINDLLDMSKIDADKFELALAKYEVASLICDVATLILVRFSSTPLKFELQVDENIPSSLLGDEIRIKQILNNLLSNAFKYTKEGMVKLSISAETGNEGKESGVTLVLRVSDTGLGMTKEQVAMLFDEYSRFNMEANRKTEGTGLGMHITRNLVRLMNGEIKAESEIGKGTTVTVRLPQKDVGAVVLGREVADNLQQFDEYKATYKKRTRAVLEPMPYGRVLIVDDVELNLFVAEGLLTAYELSIDAALSGYEAIEKIKDGYEYDIVFMDYMMPEMDGLETVKKIRGLGYSRPIIALTADAVSGQAEMFLKNGFDHFISKPIDMRQVEAVLKTFVRDIQPREVIEAAREARNKKADEEAFQA